MILLIDEVYSIIQKYYNDDEQRIVGVLAFSGFPAAGLHLLAFSDILLVENSEGLQDTQHVLFSGSLLCVDFRFLRSLHRSHDHLRGFDQVETQSRDDSDQTQFEKLVINTIYMPDAIILLIYFTLYWQVLICYYRGYITSGARFRGIHSLAIPISFRPRVRPYFPEGLCQHQDLLLCVLVCAGAHHHSLLGGLLLGRRLPLHQPGDQLHHTMLLIDLRSGSLLQVSKLRKKLKQMAKLIIWKDKINRLVMFLAIMRVVQVILNVFLLNYIEKLYQFFQGNLKLSDFYMSIIVFLLVCDFFLTSVFPFFYALRSSFQKIFLEVQMNNNSRHSMKRLFKNSQDSSQLERTLLEFCEKDIVYVNDKKLKRSNGLGYLQLADIFSKPYYVRVVELPQVTRYLIEDCEKEIQQVNELNHDYVCHIHGFFKDENKILLVYKKYEYDSLESNLHQEDLRLNYLLQIARSLEYLHNLNRWHGHLHPGNIMINKNKKVKIADVGLLSLKKYCNIFLGYTNKSSYTPPELLDERGICVGSREGDVYSLGMVAYQLFSGKRPFKDAELKEVRQVVVRQNGRPKIEEGAIPEYVALLIRQCWQADPGKRPGIGEVIKVIENIME